MPKQTQKTLEQAISELYNPLLSRDAMISALELGFIYGPFGTDIHYLQEEIRAKIDEYELTLNPVEETNPIE